MAKIEEKIAIIKNSIEEKKGIDTQILDISKLTSIADYFIITSGNSSTQVTSIADEVESKMTQAGYEKIVNKEGYKSGRWVLMDYDDIIVHIFHKEEREFYNLERLWSEYERDNSDKEK